MPKCKVCSSQYHYCSSCGFDTASDLGYCSDHCMDNGDEIKRWRFMAIAIITGLSPLHKGWLHEFIDGDAELNVLCEELRRRIES